MCFSGCSTIHKAKDFIFGVKNEVIGNKDIEGKSFNLKYVNSAVFDKTIAMYALSEASEIDVSMSKGVSINAIPKRLDDIFVAAVDKGAELNFIDEKTLPKQRAIPFLVSLISAYSDYKQVGDTYRQYIDDKSKVKLGKYSISVYYNGDSGEISHITFTHKDNLD
jgi:hypothetical protein